MDMAPTVTCVCCKTDVCNKVDGCVRVIVAWQIATIFFLQRCHIKNIRTKKENATSGCCAVYGIVQDVSRSFSALVICVWRCVLFFFKLLSFCNCLPISLSFLLMLQNQIAAYDSMSHDALEEAQRFVLVSSLSISVALAWDLSYFLQHFQAQLSDILVNHLDSQENNGRPDHFVLAMPFPNSFCTT